MRRSIAGVRALTVGSFQARVKWTWEKMGPSARLTSDEHISTNSHICFSTLEYHKVDTRYFEDWLISIELSILDIMWLLKGINANNPLDPVFSYKKWLHTRKSLSVWELPKYAPPPQTLTLPLPKKLLKSFLVFIFCVLGYLGYSREHFLGIWSLPPMVGTKSFRICR